MQREIAEVMASCALRGFRYISFPPIVFATPAPLAAPASEAEAALAPILPEVLPAMPSPATAVAPADASEQDPPAPALVIAAAPVAPNSPPESGHSHEFGPAPTAAPMPAMRRLAEFATTAPDPLPPTGRLRRLAELTATESLDSPDAASAPRRYALLNDIAIELRPRRVRARTGRSP